LYFLFFNIDIKLIFNNINSLKKKGGKMNDKINFKDVFYVFKYTLKTCPLKSIRLDSIIAIKLNEYSANTWTIEFVLNNMKMLQSIYDTEELRQIELNILHKIGIC
jgi:hypothetical protein